VKGIDRNRHGLSKRDAKFYSIIIAPEDKELEHIAGDKQKLKQFTREVMDTYAKSFSGKDGLSKNLTAADLNYFCKLEDHRYYKGSDKEVLKGLAKQGDKKPGSGHMHIHIIVGRKDKESKYKLSPTVNNKKIFHAEGFMLKSCYEFDRRFNYRGSGHDLEAHMEKRTGHRKDIDLYKHLKREPVIYQLPEKDPDRDKGMTLGLDW